MEGTDRINGKRTGRTDQDRAGDRGRKGNHLCACDGWPGADYIPETRIKPSGGLPVIRHRHHEHDAAGISRHRL